MIKILKLINHNKQLAKIYLERTKSKDKDVVLREMYVEFVENNPELRSLYAKLNKKEPEHVPYDTSITKTLSTLIAMYGWRAVIDDFVLLAKNKEITLKRCGLTEQSKTWQKVQKCLKAIPKKPQL